MKYDFLIVGSGLFGSTFAHFATKAGKSCLLLEKRNHVGGNVYTELDSGILVHKYGPHIFHTNDKEVWDFVNSFVPFNNFINCPLAFSNHLLYNLPFNMNTFQQIWSDVHTPVQAKMRIQSQIRDQKKKLGITQPRNLEEYCLLSVGETIYNLLIKEYTEKQWGRPCSELPPSIIKRLPLRFTYNNNYFNDKYQGVPIGGYTKLIKSLLKGVDYDLEADFFKYYSDNKWRKFANCLVYTGPIDQYFNYKYGQLDWRSLSFNTKKIGGTSNYQGNAVVNYISKDISWTRIIEHKHFYQLDNSVDDFTGKAAWTIITTEYPAEFKLGMEPYYPINDNKNESILRKYNELASKEPDVIFGGRLATYRYLNMDEVIKQCIIICKNIFG